MSVRVRFAPSPTGRLHVGNIYIALHNWLYARKAGGEFLLRLDDTDRERSTEDFANGIKADLEWLGLAWNLFDRQSARLAIYDAAAKLLRDAGRLYPCYESAEELGLKRKVQLSQSKPPIYDRAALKLTDADRAKLEAEGKRPHWRFKLEARDIAWDDLIRGPQHVDETSQSDPVLIREDGSYLYTLCSVVDDIEFGISHIIRGADHGFSNTATQIQIFDALGAAAPAFAHLPLLVDAAGEGLSKRLGSLSVGQMREDGLEPMAINAYLAKIGTGDPVVPVRSLDDLVAQHDLAKFGKSSPRFDPDELKHLNAKLLHHLPFEEARSHLAAIGLGHIDPAVWDVARANVEKVEDVALWQSVVKGPVTPAIADTAFAAKAAELLPPEPWNAETWSAWTNAVRSATGRKGKDLFMPLRQALTASDHGPELKLLLPLIGRERALKRLKGETA
ncbi:MAG TPA: glutamate--tRNA ligase [Dongiaceae bacterium]|jgi:glutamyl-tRNA synthetase|nr:glutamate--tRNA ligase [Dongiaceae bacterium]